MMVSRAGKSGLRIVSSFGRRQSSRPNTWQRRGRKRERRSQKCARFARKKWPP
jgi:hypothetical protein